MVDNKKSSDKKREVSDEAKRSKKQKRLRQQNEQEQSYKDMIDELLDDEQMYQILKQLKD